MNEQPGIDPVVAQQLRARLADAKVGAEVEAVVEQAIGPVRAGGALGDGAGSDSSAGVYLKSISVEGFRGIGPSATLELKPEPGLTVVVGRNGSGKSSFAEALELLLTGTTKRWDTQTKVWSSAWQCLHHDGPTRVAGELVVGGEAEPIRIEREWARGDGYDDRSGAQEVEATIAGRGWAEALSSFRPFLSYGELAGMFDKLNSLYDALSPVLGLENVDAVLARVSDARLALDNEAKDSKKVAAAIVTGLDAEDARQAALGKLLSKRAPDLAAITAHLEAHPPGISSGAGDAALKAQATLVVPDDDAIRSTRESLDGAREREQLLATTDAQQARRVATLLETALQARDSAQAQQDCPVCGTADVLDAAWDLRASDEIQALRGRAAELEAASQATRAAERAWANVIGPLGLAPDAEPDAAIAAATKARADGAAARAQLEQLDQDWRATVEAVTAWAGRARLVADRAAELVAAKEAEKWLKGAADDLRNERFAPIANQAVENWKQLRHESNVDVRAITFKSVGRRKETSFDVRADGEEASALGVMSQGELLALSVSVFLPRAGLDESPFRFAIIDDPVQSMDPAKVDGLARVLAEAAKTRQVVVFTHDDRLPQAVQRLRLRAVVLQVHRRSRSQVAVDQISTPLMENLKQARALLKSRNVPAEVQQRVVPMLCRSALEAACADIVRARAVRTAGGLDDADTALGDAHTLRAQLALALLGDRNREPELNDRLAGLGDGADLALIRALNSGVHGDEHLAIVDLPTRTENFVHAMLLAT